MLQAKLPDNRNNGNQAKEFLRKPGKEMNSSMVFSEGGLGETALLAQKSGFPQHSHPLIPLLLTPLMMYLRRNTNTRNRGALTRATAAI